MRQAARAILLLLAGLLAGAGTRAETNGTETARPADAMLVEAETLAPGRADGWVADEYGMYSYAVNLFGAPSRLAWLQGAYSVGRDATATGTVTIAAPGRYRVWVRCRNFPAAAFRVELQQGGAPVAAGDFDARTAARPEPSGGYADGPYVYAWWALDAPLAAGPCRLRLTQLGADVPLVDCFVFTTDRDYAPRLRDFAPPVYLRIVAGPGHRREGSAFYFHGRIDRPPYFTVGDIVTKAGLLRTEENPAVPPAQFLRPGECTPWVNVGPHLDPRGLNRTQVDAGIAGWYRYLPAADFTVEIATSPAGPVLKRYHRAGTGSGLALVIDALHPERTYSNIDGSARDLARARALPAAGQRPATFPLLTGLQDYDTQAPEGAIRNDLLALRALGFTGSDCAYRNPWIARQGFRYLLLGAYCYHLTRGARFCLSAPDAEGMRRYFADALRDQANPHLKPVFLKLMDEYYSVGIETGGQHAMRGCPSCEAWFRAWLQGQGVQPADLLPGLRTEAGADPWQAIHPSEDRATPALYYYSKRAAALIGAAFFKTATDAVRALDPTLRTGANTSIELTYGRNMYARNSDLFDNYRSGALTYGFAEDANGSPPSAQTATFIIDVLRAACKYRQLPYGTYNMGGPRWDIVAKTVAEIGHGCSLIHFYNYGPFHSTTSDAAGNRPEFVAAVKQANCLVGAAEGLLAGARPAPARVALLYSATTDIWTDILDVPSMSNAGTERVGLYLLLRHLGYPVDIVTEDDVLEGRVGGYRAIVLAESHLKAGVLPALLAWARGGGRLVATAGAARFDQFNRPLPDWDAVGLRRGPFAFSAAPGYWPYSLAVAATVDAPGGALEAAGGSQPPAAECAGTVVERFTGGAPCSVDLPLGRGRVVYLGWFPGTSYMRLASLPLIQQLVRRTDHTPPPATDSSTAFPAALRDAFRARLAGLAATPPVRVSHPLVEGCLLERPGGAAVLALANWTGAAQTVSVAVDLSFACAAPRAVAARLAGVTRRGRTLAFTLTVGPGDFVLLPKRARGNK